MKVKAFHPKLTNRRSYLTAKANSGQKDLVVLSGANYSANDLLVIGNPSEENTEIGKIASVTGNTITLAVNLGGTHAQNTPITVIDYDQVELWKATSKDGTYALVAGTIVNLAIDDEYTLLEDAAASSTDYFKIKYYNTITTTYSGFSDPIGQDGFKRYALSSIQDHALRLANDEKEKRIKRIMITEWVNEWKDHLAGEIVESNEKYFLTKREYTLVSGTQEYELINRIRKASKIEANLDGGGYYRVTFEDIEDDRPDFVYSASNPFYYLNAGKIGFRPTPSASGIAKVWQEEQPADLENDSDELADPMRYYLANLYDFLEHKIFKQMRKHTAADSAWNKFMVGVDNIVEQINSRVLDQNQEVKENDSDVILE